MFFPKRFLVSAFAATMLLGGPPSYAQFDPGALMQQMQKITNQGQQAEGQPLNSSAPSATGSVGNCAAEPKIGKFELNDIGLGISEKRLTCLLPTMKIEDSPVFSRKGLRYYSCLENCKFRFANFDVANIEAVFKDGQLGYLGIEIDQAANDTIRRQNFGEILRPLTQKYGKAISAGSSKDLYDVAWYDASTQLRFSRSVWLGIAKKDFYDFAESAINEYYDIDKAEKLAAKSPVAVHSCLNGAQKPYNINALHSISGVRIGISESQLLCIVPKLKLGGDSQSKYGQLNFKGYRCEGIQNCDMKIAGEAVDLIQGQFVDGELISYIINFAHKANGPSKRLYDLKLIFNQRYGVPTWTDSLEIQAGWYNSASRLLLQYSSINIESPSYELVMKSLENQVKAAQEKTESDVTKKRIDVIKSNI